EQDHHSIRNDLIEETYEVIEAIDTENPELLREELGDVMLQVVFHARIEEEKGSFTIEDVIHDICAKMIHRHPHVFGTTEVSDAEQVVKNWEQLKTAEKDGNKRVLSGVPESMPAIIKAYRMQDKARAVGFDWTEKEQVWDKVKEEIAEFEAEITALGKQKEVIGEEKYKHLAENELGDLLFSIINAARLYDLNPDTALESTCKKFRRRFTYLEEKTIRAGKNLKDMTLEQMDEIWNEAKSLEK
ncbi:MAG: nucleoside triphosphate pyrophosphohydrolase, partial [Bacteroidales bacterium]|nr:nucleoside triphosphate pyrophosphohydrolase [Bacteroidales bacterium]